MGKVLKINLGSQREIQQEGVQKNISSLSGHSLEVGKIKTYFFLPKLNVDSDEDAAQKITPPVQEVVSRINKFIENIADDYFLLGLHLISLHSLLRESKLTTEQIKLWYTEHINMPYSSAMQCRKVAEVYSENPELIGRYTASGAYLLSSCKTPEEREQIWQEAKGDKSAPSTRDLRETIKLFRARKFLDRSVTRELIKERNNSNKENMMSQKKIRASIENISLFSENLFSCKKTEERSKMRKVLIDSVKKFLSYIEEKT